MANYVRDVPPRMPYRVSMADSTPQILLLAAGGCTAAQIAPRVHLAPRTVRAILQRHRETGALDAAAFEQEGKALEEQKPLVLDRVNPRRVVVEEGLDEAPTIHHHPDLPGWAAWEAVHHHKLEAKAAARRLGLKYPGQVFELLAVHKRALEARLTAEASAAAGRAP